MGFLINHKEVIGRVSHFLELLYMMQIGEKLANETCSMSHIALMRWVGYTPLIIYGMQNADYRDNISCWFLIHANRPGAFLPLHLWTLCSSHFWKCSSFSLSYVFLTLSSRLSLTPVTCMKFLLMVLDPHVSPPPECLTLGLSRPFQLSSHVSEQRDCRKQGSGLNCSA